eukprot:gene34125-biopygen14559
MRPRGASGEEVLAVTHLELEAVVKTVQSFLRELTGKVVRLWADRLSRDRDLDDRRLNRRWFRWAEREWHRHTVDRFASELSAQLPRYYAQWHEPGCEGVDSLAFSWLGEVNWINPPWSLLDEVAHKLWEEGCAATVVAPYWPGQMRFEQLEALADEVKVHRPVDKARYTGTVGDTGADGLTRVAYEDEDKEDLDMSKEKFEVIPAAVQQTQGAALGSNTVDNSRPKTRAFMNISEAEGKGRDHQEDLDMSKDKAATELLRACAYVVFAFVIFGRPDTGVSMRQEHIGITAPGSELRGAVQLLEAAVGVGEAPVSTS